MPGLRPLLTESIEFSFETRTFVMTIEKRSRSVGSIYSCDIGLRNWVKFVSHTTEPASLVYRFIGLHFYVIVMSVQETTIDTRVMPALSPYSKFKLALKSKEVQRQYPNLLERFLDFCEFEGLNIEQKAIKFSSFAKSKSQEEVEDLGLCYIKRRG
jgi:hypothetical protein